MSKNCFARPYKKIENRLKNKSFVKVKRKETKSKNIVMDDIRISQKLNNKG